MKNFYLISTDHLENMLWFKDDEDYAVGMNHVAIQACLSATVIILAFILMSNHVHFVVYGEYEDVLNFINRFKQRYSKYYQKKYGVKEFLHRNGVHIELIPDGQETLRVFIAYVQMNCVGARICAHPSQYPWGTGATFFNPSKYPGTRLDSLSGRAKRKLLHSMETDLPGSWTVDPRGFIMPECFVDVTKVEKCYGTPGRMNYFLNASSKAKVRLGAADSGIPAFTDKTILAALPNLCRSLFQKDSFASLQKQEQVECARQIRYRFSADPHQIARVCGTSYAEMANLLDSV